jgi:hypothetical protein
MEAWAGPIQETRADLKKVDRKMVGLAGQTR